MCGINKLKSIYIFASTPVCKGTYDSHVFSLAKLLSENSDYKVNIIAFCSDTKEEMILLEKAKYISGTVFKIKRGGTFISHLRELNKIFQNLHEECIVHTQNYYCGFLISQIKAKNNNIILHADLKGLVPEEFLCFSSDSLPSRIVKYVIAKYFERVIIKRSDSLGVVSNQFKNHLIQKYYYQKEIYVFPSVYDKNIFYYSAELRNQTRRRYKIKDDSIVIAYSGNIQKWQNINFFLSFVKNFQDERIKFLFITRIDKNFLIKKYQLEKYLDKIIFVGGSQKRVNALLNASDFCFLARNNHVINQVSSPTKFCEYIATGNKVIISSKVGDFSNLVEKNNLGIVLDNISAIDFAILEKLIVAKNSFKIDNSFYQFFDDNYSYQSRIKKTMVLYNKLYEDRNNTWHKA